MTPSPEFALLDRSALLTLIAELQEQIAQLQAEVARLQTENERLRREGHRQAAPFSKGTRTPDPKRPGRKPGQGPFTYRLAPTPEHVTEPPIDVTLDLPSCPCCGEALLEHRVDFASITELPPRPQPRVQPYRVWVYRCPRCEAMVRAAHPDLAPDQQGATAHRMGPRVMAAAHLLHYGIGVTVRKVPAVLQALTGVRLTQSAITQDALRRARAEVGCAYQALRQAVAQAPVVYTDDTGWRIQGEAAHLMGFETDEGTVYQVRTQHRNEEVREVIPGDYAGTMVTDRGKSYDAEELAGVKQQKCLFHVLRSIQEVLETKQGIDRCFGLALKNLLRDALQLWHDFRDGKVPRVEYDAQGQGLRRRLGWVLRERTVEDPENQRLLKGLRWQHERGNLVRFLDDPRIEPTNHRAEQTVRFGVIQRKVSQCSKNALGAEAFAAFTSVIRTVLKKGGDVVERLSQLFQTGRAREAPS